MTVNELLQGIAKQKEVLKITNQMIAEASGVPKTTVDRILRGDTANPSMQTVLDIANVVGYRITNDNDSHASSVDCQLVNMLERESRLKTVQSNSLIAAKDENIAGKDHWIKFLIGFAIVSVALLVLTWVGIAFVLHYDLTHADSGFFRW